MYSEVLLLVLAVGLYIYDSAMLLYDNEVILVRVDAIRGWKSLFPSDTFDILGRALFIPNPLCPHQFIFRLYWHANPVISPRTLAGLSDRGAMDCFRKAMVPLGVLIIISLIVLFICLPAALLVPGVRGVFFVFLAILYGIAITALVLVFRNRTTLGLDARSCIMLGVETLICIPVFPNLIRKISIRYSPQHDLVFVAGALLGDEQFTTLLSSLLRKIEEQISVADEESRRYTELAKYRQTVAAVIE